MDYDSVTALYVREDCIAGWEPRYARGDEEEHALIHLTSGQTVKVKGGLDERLSALLDDNCESWDYTTALSVEGVREHYAREAVRQQAARQRAAEKNAAYEKNAAAAAKANAKAKAKAERPPFRMREVMEELRVRAKRGDDDDI